MEPHADDSLIESHEKNFDRLSQNINELYQLVREHTQNYYKTDKPMINSHETFIKNLVRAMWIVFTPIIAGVGVALFIVGFEAWQNHMPFKKQHTPHVIEERIK